MSALRIEVDDFESPSQSIEGKGGPQPAWRAKVFYGPEEEGHYVEAVSVGGPGAAVSFALTIYSNVKRRGDLHGT